MMETKPLNMMEELYIDTLRDSVTYCVPAKLHDWAVNALKSATTGEKKFSAFETLLKVCIAEGCFWEGINAIDRIINDPEMMTYRARLLFHAGEMSERLYDFNAAIAYYSRSLACATRPEDLHTPILSNLGFCYLYKQNFKTAELCCCQAIKFNPRSWEAWKNLGVSFEHQQLIKGAFFAYFKAVFLSRGQVVPVMHLTRLSQRHPGIVPDVGALKPTVYRAYEIIL